MLYDFIQQREGDVFCQCVNLADTTTAPLVIVKPRASRRGVQADKAGEILTTNSRIIVLGFAYTSVSTAAGKNFQLGWLDHPGSPTGTPDTSVFRYFWNHVAGSTAAETISVPYTYIEGRKGVYSPAQALTDPGISPFVIGNFRSSSASDLAIVSSASLTGCVLIWGIHDDGIAPSRIKGNLSQSPGLDYNTAT